MMSLQAHVTSLSQGLLRSAPKPGEHRRELCFRRHGAKNSSSLRASRRVARPSESSSSSSSSSSWRLKATAQEDDKAKATEEDDKAPEPSQDPSEAGAYTDGIFEGIGNFDAISIDAYIAVDKDYKDLPNRMTNHAMLSSEETSKASSYVGTDDEERLGPDYKFARAEPGCKKEVILLQGFDWDSWRMECGWYNRLSEMVDDIAQSGFTHVWLPPPSQSVSAEGYLPSVLYNMDTKYGSHKQLKDVLRKFNEAGVAPMADIVINHRCAQAQDENGVWNQFGNEYQEKYGLGGYGADHMRGIDWGRWAITCDDPSFDGSGNPDSGADFEAAPDLDHHNPDLRAALKDWLNWLHYDIGFGGWRMDFVKGYAPEYNKEYIDDTIGPDVFHVSELWTDMHWEGSELGRNQDAARQAICDWCEVADGSSTAFDFPTKGILQYAVAHCEYDRLADHEGKPTGVLGWWPEVAVTFVDNHDTGGSQNHWPFPKYHVGLGYGYIMTHPGTPCVFWPHLYGSDEELSKTIRALIEIRKRNGIVSDSPIKVKRAEHDIYVAEINERVVFKCGPRRDMGDLLPNADDGWKMAVKGKDFAVWEKCE